MQIANSPWSKYVQEKDNVQILETNQGFIVYTVSVPECYISEIYTAPEFRKQNVASKLADEVAKIAKEAGCKYLTGSVRPNANHSKRSMQVLFAYGFELHSSQQNIIYLKKDLI